MAEKQANDLFLLYKKKIIKILGNKATTDAELNEVGMRMFPKKFRGVYPQDKFPSKSGYYIVNTDVSTGPGEHWVAVYSTASKLYIYDSFGRCSKKLLKHLTKNNTKKEIVDSQYDAEQFGDSEICGPLCLSWLAVVRDLGIKKALLV
jgi:hypothetical protein